MSCKVACVFVLIKVSKCQWKLKGFFQETRRQHKYLSLRVLGQEIHS